MLLAAGGFPNDVERRREFFPKTPTGKEHWTLAPAQTTGDGITLGEQVGGQLDDTLASPAAWCPVSLVPYRSGRVGTYPHIVDRGKPGLIAVTAERQTLCQRGRRLLPVHHRDAECHPGR